MDAKIGLLIQFVGVLLMTTLSWLLRRSLKTPASGNWAAAWASLTIALACLSFAFLYPNFARPLFAIYFFGEYAFGLLLALGCRAIAVSDEKLPRRWLLFASFAALAVALPYSGAEFAVIFNLHTLVLGTFFAVAYHTLGRASSKRFGWRTMRVALALLALDFYHYFAIYLLHRADVSIALPENYSAYSPLMDLILEVMLAFGMVITQLEGVLDEMRRVNAKLKDAHEQLESLALVDPLTTALNRHAFYGFLHKRGNEPNSISGCVGFFDIDDLKPINDHLGHAVGDHAIRAVVSTIRDLVRAEDLIYRWGGDEFFVLLVSMNAAQARERMSTLERRLTDVHVEGADGPMTIGVSYGFHDFNDASELESAIKHADEAMYREKQTRKAANGSEQRRYMPPDGSLSWAAKR